MTARLIFKGMMLENPTEQEAARRIVAQDLKLPASAVHCLMEHSNAVLATLEFEHAYRLAERWNHIGLQVEVEPEQAVPVAGRATRQAAPPRQSPAVDVGECPYYVEIARLLAAKKCKHCGEEVY